MERRMWGFTKGKVLYPNLYTILVATPGVGKSNILSSIEAVIRQVPNIFVAPSSMTTASLIDTMALAKRQLTVAGLAVGTAIEYNSLQIVASELGVFLPAWDPSFLNTLTKLYDGELYEERRRTGKVNHLVIENPLLSIIGGSTPGYLGATIPESAWEQGFTSRVIFIFSNEIVKTDIWDEGIDTELKAQIETDLVADLTTISTLYGKIEWDDESKNAISGWDEKSLEPVPVHPKLLNYNSRRLTHLLKLCMIASIARSNDRRVNLSDCLTARHWLLEAERVMPDVFNKMVKSIDGAIIDEALLFVRQIYARDGGKAVSEPLLYNYLRDKTTVGNIEKIIQVMQRSNQIKRVINHMGLPALEPVIF